MTSITYRPGTISDSYPIFRIFEETLADLSRRMGSTEPTSWQDPSALEQMWQERCSLYEHLAQTAAHFWLAEEADQTVGFARSIMRDGILELTEFFVRPERQAGGVGRELLARVFPPEGARCRFIIASTDSRAQARYLKTGVYPSFPIYYFSRVPTMTVVESDLQIEPIEAALDKLEILGDLDQTLLGYRRKTDHTWLLNNRQGYLYCRQDQVVGYGYTGHRNGPFALLNPDDFPAILAHAENQAAAVGRSHFGLEVPLVNRTAVNYLLAHNFRMDSFIAILMSDVPFGQFEHYLLASPPFFL